MAFAGKIAYTHNNGTKSLTFTENFNLYELQNTKNNENLKL